MAEEEENELSSEPEFPKSRVKKIMTLDKDVKRVSSEALFLVSRSTELFLQLLAEKSAEAAIEKKRKTVKLEHIRIAVKRNQHGKSVPVGTRRIDHIFRKSEAQDDAEAPEPMEES
ncbi:unnamed protein product [Vicia faba]|uniref:Transcription factor CBF/NF-Y/archaeal histone domain-containing protein n=1 Tax=Vicia faba TaxID=3906 RepID=A0AAV0ZLU6_VICFA|nr:unnamed protein product [Vicia faba]